MIGFNRQRAKGKTGGKKGKGRIAAKEEKKAN